MAVFCFWNPEGGGGGALAAPPSGSATELQEDFTKLEHWADIWEVKFNPSKCSVLRVKRPRAKEVANSDSAQRGYTGEVYNSP